MAELYLDTSTPVCTLKINQKTYTWHSGTDLAERLHAFLLEKLSENHLSLSEITKITFMSGPGSFTGLRIGATIVNALAHELNIPLFDHHGQQHSIIIPIYGRPANITPPKK